MSVMVTLRVSVDPAAFEEQVNGQGEVIERIMGIAKSKGLIGHRWYAGEGEVVAVDEWPDGDSFNAFFEEAQPEIGPLMQAAGVTSPPEVKVWNALDLADTI
jgi:hypothetical protein